MTNPSRTYTIKKYTDYFGLRRYGVFYRQNKKPVRSYSTLRQARKENSKVRVEL